MRNVLAALSLLAVAGCQTTTVQYAYKPNTSVTQKDRDSLECEVYATRLINPNVQTGTTPTFTTPTQTNCYTIGNSVQCYTTGGQTTGGQAYSYDANAALRQDVVQQCMADRGYTFSAIPICPERIVTAEIRRQLSGQLRPATEGSCAAQITNRGSNALQSGS